MADPSGPKSKFDLLATIQQSQREVVQKMAADPPETGPFAEQDRRFSQTLDSLPSLDGGQPHIPEQSQRQMDFQAELEEGVSFALSDEDAGIASDKKPNNAKSYTEEIAEHKAADKEAEEWRRRAEIDAEIDSHRPIPTQSGFQINVRGVNVYQHGDSPDDIRSENPSVDMSRIPSPIDSGPIAPSIDEEMNKADVSLQYGATFNKISDVFKR